MKMGWIDYKKAYDMVIVPHSYALKSVTLVEMADSIIRQLRYSIRFEK